METEQYHFRVGLFFLAAAAIFVFSLVVFGGKNNAEGETTKRYAIYFTDSIAGVARGAPVKLRGITVGTVEDVRFVSRLSDRILVLADISETAPVRTDTIATVAFQGITGTAYIALENTLPASQSTFLATQKGEQYPVIASRRSDLQAVLTSAPEVMAGMKEAADRMQKLFSDENVAATQNVLAEASGALREIRMLARMLRDDPSVILRGNAYEGYKVKK